MANFPIDLPDLPIAQGTFRIEYASAVNESPFTKDQQVYNWTGETWSIQLQPAIQDKSEAGQWRSWIAKLRGRYGTFYAGDPMREQPKGSASGSATVDSTSGDNQITLKNLNGDLKAGDYVEIKDSLYILESDSSNNVINVRPRLRENYSDGTNVNLDKPQGIFRLEKSDMGWNEKDINTTAEPIVAREVIQ